MASEDALARRAGSWRFDPVQAGNTNCLGGLGTHIENAVATMTGLKIKRVLAKMDVLTPGQVLDDTDFVLLEYESGATGMYWSSQVAIGHDNSLRVRIYGDKGSVLWFQEEPEKITVIRQNCARLAEHHRGYSAIAPAAAKYGRLPSGHPEGWLEAMANLYRSFMECILAKRAGPFTSEMIDFPSVIDGVEGVKFVEACLKSSANGSVWTDL